MMRQGRKVKRYVGIIGVPRFIPGGACRRGSCIRRCPAHALVFASPSVTMSESKSEKRKEVCGKKNKSLQASRPDDCANQITDN